MTKHKIIGIITVILLILIPTTASALTGKVMQVKDGDTVVISPAEGGQFFICRLFGIDAPETARRGRAGQPHGEEAAKELKHLILGQTVDVKLTGRRTHNREVCRIYRNNKSINLAMIENGYAWAYRRFLERPYASEYINAEKTARDKRLGLWQDLNPTPPWEFRRLQRKQ